jgi:exosome complex component RRP43
MASAAAAAAGEPPPPGADAALAADAFQRLYPDLYFERFLERSVRPDGRALGAGRPLSVSLGVVATADASALVKVGATTALAGVKAEALPLPLDAPADAAAREGRVEFAVELAPLCSADTRPGRRSEAAAVLAARLAELLDAPGALDRRQLAAPPPGDEPPVHAAALAWTLFVDVYVLEADGALHDAVALAALAALASLRLRAPGAPAGAPATPLRLGRLAASTTCALHGSRVLVDPTAEEERWADGGLVSAAVDEGGRVLSLLSAPTGGDAGDGGGAGGAGAGASAEQLALCMEAARVRGGAAIAALRQALAAHEAAA